ncbi:hypothetical protein BJY00DRAFT_221446 [Aspergillus carlsbadensis]|nr:hypothetical protein BJY00DRAFT_221446 [Aspergillus carlsbadensis]
MVTRGLWNLHVGGKWYRWFHPPRGQSSSPDSPTILKTIQQILSKSNKFKLDAVPFPTPLQLQLDYVYTIDEDAGHFTVTQWKSVNGASYPRTRRATLASIQETSLSTVEALLDDALGDTGHNNHPLSVLADKNNIQHVLESFKIKPRPPARLNELQFQLFMDFVFIWRFYFDNLLSGHTPSPFSLTLLLDYYVSQHGTLRSNTRILRNCRLHFLPFLNGRRLPTTYSGFTNMSSCTAAVAKSTLLWLLGQRILCPAAMAEQELFVE